MRPRFIGTLTFMAKKGLAYTLNLSRKLRTHTVFYVGMHKPYRDPSHVNVEMLAPRKTAVPLAATSGSRHLTAPPFEDAAVPASTDASAPLQSRFEFEPTSHGDGSLRNLNQRALAPMHRPPLVFLYEQVNFNFMCRGFFRSVIATVRTSIW